VTGYYLALRHVHMTCAILSISLFTLRGLLMIADSSLLRSRILRFLPHVIDTVFFTSALILMTIVHQYPFVNGWLTMKVVLLTAYIVLGSIAIRPVRSKTTRVTAFVAALLVVSFLVSVALTHDPRGIFARLARPAAVTSP
jgi:uncharacterized membrane protein SirB2